MEEYRNGEKTETELNGFGIVRGTRRLVVIFNFSSLGIDPAIELLLKNVPVGTIADVNEIRGTIGARGAASLKRGSLITTLTEIKNSALMSLIDMDRKTAAAMVLSRMRDNAAPIILSPDEFKLV